MLTVSSHAFRICSTLSWASPLVQRGNSRPLIDPPQHSRASDGPDTMSDTPRWSLARLPLPLSRFLGYRLGSPPHSPLPFPPFSFLRHVPPQAEKYTFGFSGSFISLFLIMLSMTLPGSAFSSTYHASLIVASFGASAVLVFGAFEAPLAQPRNLVGGQFVSALIGVCLTKLFALDNRYDGWVQQTDRGVFKVVVLVNGCLSMACSLAAMEFLGVLHPP